MAYVGTFHIWMHISRLGIVVSGVFITLLLSTALVIFNKRNYFLNHFDLLWHAVVVLDIFLEAILIVDHNHYGFYLCAFSFAIVVGGYRLYLMRHRQRINATEMNRS